MKTNKPVLAKRKRRRKRPIKNMLGFFIAIGLEPRPAKVREKGD